MATYDGNPQEYDLLIKEGYEFRLGDYLQKGWDMFKGNVSLFIIFTLIYFGLQGAASGVGAFLDMQWLGNIASLLLIPLGAGYFIVGRRIDNGEPVEIAHFFDGYKDAGQLIIGNIVMFFLIMIGFMLLLLPGFYLAIAYAFMTPLIVLGRLEFWPALEVSRKLITKNWFNFLIMGIVATLIVFAGIIAFGVGVLVAAPVVSLMFYAAYDDITGGSGSTIEDKIEEIGADEV